ncbi:MAG: DUF2177 family protein [Rhodospirillales bacterium]
MIDILVACAATAATFLIADLLWIGVVARSFYRRRLARWLAERINRGAALLFYALYVVGIVVLAVGPALQAGSLQSAAGRGALLGLVAYGTYNLTNLATVRDWPPAVAVVDLGWGTAVTTAAAVAGFLAVRALG